MEITTMEGFINYYQKTRLVTKKVIGVIPPDQLDWTYKKDKFTIADLVRHIAAIERHVFAEVALNNPPNYKGCGKELADGLPDILAYLDEMHAQSIAIFRSLPDASLKRKIRSLDGKEIGLDAFLRALLVHEIHHRGVLCIYLNLLGMETPPVLGLKEEEVKRLSRNQNETTGLC
jgi:uncharacterized damage-inducible protein DinB